MNKQFKLVQFSEHENVTKKNVTEQKKDTVKDTVTVTFLKYVPQFVGTDLKIYGSYSINDIAEIPSLNSVGLIEKGGCKRVS